MYSSFVANKSTQLNILLVILVGATAVIAGGNLGYFAGRYVGAHRLGWLRQRVSSG